MRTTIVFPEVDLARANDYDEILKTDWVNEGKTWGLKSKSGW